MRRLGGQESGFRFVIGLSDLEMMFPYNDDICVSNESNARCLVVSHSFMVAGVSGIQEVPTHGVENVRQMGVHRQWPWFCNEAMLFVFVYVASPYCEEHIENSTLWQMETLINMFCSRNYVWDKNKRADDGMDDFGRSM